MIILIHFIFQIVLLSIGFGVGYCLLVKASDRDGSLKIVGEVLGWILIAMSLFVLLLSSYYSIKIAKSNQLNLVPPVNQMMQQQKQQIMNQEQPEEIEETQEHLQEEQEETTSH
jgi:hypothetical protein